MRVTMIITVALTLIMEPITWSRLFNIKAMLVLMGVVIPMKLIRGMLTLIRNRQDGDASPELFQVYPLSESIPRSGGCQSMDLIFPRFAEVKYRLLPTWLRARAPFRRRDIPHNVLAKCALIIWRSVAERPKQMKGLLVRAGGTSWRTTHNNSIHDEKTGSGTITATIRIIRRRRQAMMCRRAFLGAAPAFRASRCSSLQARQALRGRTFSVVAGSIRLRVAECAPSGPTPKPRGRASAMSLRHRSLGIRVWRSL